MTPSGLRWAVHPTDRLCHALDPAHLARGQELSSTEALCGAPLPTDGLDPARRPWGELCVPCVTDAADDLANPGRRRAAR